MAERILNGPLGRILDNVTMSMAAANNPNIKGNISPSINELTEEDEQIKKLWDEALKKDC